MKLLRLHGLSEHNKIDDYLAASRRYIEHAKQVLSGLGVCSSCRLNKLESNQIYLERLAWIKSHNQMGFLPVVWAGLAIGSVIAYLGTYVYKHYTDSKMQSDYLDCLNEKQAQLIASGVSEADALERAGALCSGSGTNTASSIEGTIKLVIYGAIAIMGLYFGIKLLTRKKKLNSVYYSQG